MPDLSDIPPPFDDTPREHDWPPRGSCPVCESAEVTHVVIGMPVPGEMETAPPWVNFAGCVVTSEHNRYCESCGHAWVHGYEDDA